METGSRKDADRSKVVADTIKALSVETGQQIGTLRSSIREAGEALEALKKDELAGLSQEIVNLEQKVAKWVHAGPLPAKLSEARLYSMEVRLTEETEARLLLETKLKSKARTTSGSLTAREQPASLPKIPAIADVSPPPYSSRKGKNLFAVPVELHNTAIPMGKHL